MFKYFPFAIIVTVFLVACVNIQPTPEPIQTATAVIAEVVERETAVPPTNTPSPSATPTQIPLPTSTPKATATITPSPTSTVPVRVLAGTAVPQPSQPISPENVTQLTELARWGRGMINDIDLSGNGRWLAVGTATGVYIHDAQDLSKTVFHLETPTAVESVTISPDGSLIAINLSGELIQVWNVLADELIYEKILNAEGVKFSPNGEYVILNNRHDGVYIMHTTDGEIVKTYPSFIDANFSLNNEQIAVWNLDRLSLYKWADGSLLKQIEPTSYQDNEDREYESLIGDADFITEDELIMSALPFNVYDVIGRILLQKVDDESVIFTTPGIRPLTEPTKYVCNEPIFYGHPPLNPQPYQMELSPDGQTVAFVFRDVGYSDDSSHHTSIRVFQKETGNLLFSVEDKIIDIAISPDGKTWVAGSQNGYLQLRSLTDGTVLDSFDGYDAPALNTAVSPDNELVAVEYLDEIKIYRAADGTLLYRYSAQRMAFSPDGQTLALGYDDGRIEIRSLIDNSILKTILGHTDGVTAVTFLPSGELVSAGLDCRLQIWRPEDGAPIKTLENYIVEGAVSGDPVSVRVWKLSISQENEFLVGDFAWTVGIWHVKEGTLINVLDRQSRSENSATFSNRLATAGYPSFIGQLDADGQFIESWESNDTVKAVAFSPDGELLVSSPYTSALLFFLAETGKMNFEIFPATEQVTSLNFAPNGRYFVSTTIDGVVRLWGVP